MRFTVRGEIDGRPCHATWEDGVLVDATPVLAARVRMSVARRQELPILLGPPVVADLADPGAAVETIAAAFDGPVRVDTDDGQAPPLPQELTAAR